MEEATARNEDKGPALCAWLAAAAFAGACTAIILVVIKAMVGIRANSELEDQGLDLGCVGAPDGGTFRGGALDSGDDIESCLGSRGL